MAQPTPPSVDCSKLRILVVDDMLTMRKIVTQQLRNFGATTIKEAPDGAAAWELIQGQIAANSPFDLVISDWNMPQVTGLELLKKVRANPATKSLAFLLVTAEAEAGQVKDAITAGADNYLVKPFTPASFQEKLTSVYNKRLKK